MAAGEAVAKGEPPPAGAAVQPAAVTTQVVAY